VVNPSGCARRRIVPAYPAIDAHLLCSDSSTAQLPSPHSLQTPLRCQKRRRAFVLAPKGGWNRTERPCGRRFRRGRRPAPSSRCWVASSHSRPNGTGDAHSLPNQQARAGWRPSGVGPSAQPARWAGTWLAWPRRHRGPRRSTSPWRLSSPPGNRDSHFVLSGTSGGRRSDSRRRREIAHQRPQLRTPFSSASHLGDRVLRPPHRVARFFRVAEHARRARPAAAGPRATPMPTSSPWSRPLQSRPGAAFLAAPAAGRSTGLNGLTGNPTGVGCARRAGRPLVFAAAHTGSTPLGRRATRRGSAERSAPHASLSLSTGPPGGRLRRKPENGRVLLRLGVGCAVQFARIDGRKTGTGPESQVQSSFDFLTEVQP